jgi:hypothetical protein
MLMLARTHRLAMHKCCDRSNIDGANAVAEIDHAWLEEDHRPCPFTPLRVRPTAGVHRGVRVPTNTPIPLRYLNMLRAPVAGQKFSYTRVEEI